MQNYIEKEELKNINKVINPLLGLPTAKFYLKFFNHVVLKISNF